MSSQVLGHGAEHESGSTPRAGRPRASLDYEKLQPEVAEWAEYLRGLIDSSFHKDADAAAALSVDAPDLSKYLSGKKMPERSFAQTIHTVCARQADRSVDQQEVRHAEALYLSALEQFNPTMWRLLSVLDQRAEAVAREHIAQKQLTKLRRWQKRYRHKVAQLQRELAAAVDAQTTLAAEVRKLLEQVRQLQGEAAVAEAMRIVEHAATEPPERVKYENLFHTTGVVLTMSTLIGTVGLGAAAIGASLDDWETRWQTAAWIVSGAAAAAAFITSWLRRNILKRLGAWRNFQTPLAALLTAISFMAPLSLVSSGIRSQQDHLEHRVKVSAEVSECDANPSSSSDSYLSYMCTYTWVIDEQTYQQRDAGIKASEGDSEEILIDPADPSIMLPDRLVLRNYIWIYIIAILALSLPAGSILVFRTSWENDLIEVRSARRRVQDKENRTSYEPEYPAAAFDFMYQMFRR